MKCLCKLLNLSNGRLPHLPSRFYVTRKFPINAELEKELPTFNYPKARKGDKRVYSWGLAETGALGLHTSKTSLKYDARKRLHFTAYPTRMTFGEIFKVTDVACGYGFTLYSVRGDEVPAFGSGINVDMQLGYHDPHHNHPLEMLLAPAPIRLNLRDREGTRAIDVAAGRAHTVVLTDKEGAFTLGNNSYGQCGRRIIPDEDHRRICTVHRLPDVDGEKIAKVVCGQDHSMFLSDKGNVFACGWGSDGQLGNGTYDTRGNVSRVIGDIQGEKIVKISCAADCVLALNDKGEVFGWGNTEYGQLDSEGVQQLNVSKAVTKCRKLGKIVDVASAGSYCVALNEHGELFSWGFGILGAGPEARHSLDPVNVPSKLFVNDFAADARVTGVACGLNHSMATTSAGELFSWGKNSHGCLGLGHERDQFFPLRVSVGAEVLKVACGVDHSVALCRPFV